MSLESGRALSDRKVGPITHEHLRAYAQASGDPNPIHLEDEAARKAGLPGVIAHGMLSAAFLAERALEVVASEDPQGRWRISSFQARFKAMTFPGDTLDVGAKVRTVSSSELVLEIEARNPKGEVTTAGSATFKR